MENAELLSGKRAAPQVHRAQARLWVATAMGVLFAALLACGCAAHEAHEDFCLDEFFGDVGPTEYLETGRSTRLEGEFKLVMAMDKDGHMGHGYYLDGKEHGSDKKDKFTLVFGQDPPKGVIGGSKVAATGKLNGKVLSIKSGGDASSFEVTAAAEVAAATGNYNITIIPVNFLDSTLGATSAQISDVATVALSNFYQEASYGKMTVSFTVKNTVTINYNGLGNCNYGTWASAADQAAGVNSGYRMYVLAPSGCGWGGLAYLPGNQSWINGSYWSWQAVYPHEFGHNIGMHHAYSYLNNYEYGDHSCCMGNPSYPPHCNAPHKVQMGWMNSGTVTTTSANGSYTYTLTALESNTTSTQIIKIPKADTGDNYYVSYRAPIGLDATNLEGGYQNGTSVHHYSSGATWTYLKGVFFDGQTYTDSVNGISITQTAHTSNTCTIQVSINANARPTAVATATPTSGNAPLLVTLDGTASSDPDGTITSYSWYFGDGATGSGATVQHTYANPGTYYPSLTVTDNSGAAASANTSAITVLDPNALNAPSNLSASVSGSTVTLNWSDNSPNETSFVIDRGVKTGKGNNATTTWTPAVGTVSANVRTWSQSASAGTYQYRVRAHNASTGVYSAYSNQVQARVR